MTAAKKVESNRVAPRAGFLICHTCKRIVPYNGAPEPISEPWPLHRCRAEIRPFNEWTAARPIPLPPAPPESTEST